MKVKFDEAADALYLELSDADVIESEEVKDGVVFDYDKDGQVVGIEILKVKARVPNGKLKHMAFEIA